MKIVLCGQMCAGKTFTYDYYVRHGFTGIKRRDIIRSNIIHLYPNKEKEKNLKMLDYKAAEYCRETRNMGIENFLFEMSGISDRVIIDGVKSITEAKIFNTGDFILIGLFANEEKRIQRCIDRKDDYDQNESARKLVEFEEEIFKTSQMELWLKENGHIVIDTTDLSIEEMFAKVDQAVQNYYFCDHDVKEKKLIGG